MKATPQTFDDLKISATFSVSDQNYSPMALGAMICAPHFIAEPAQLKLCLNNKNSFNLIDNFQRCNHRYHPNFRGQVNREKQLSLETLARLPNDASQASSQSASIKVSAKSNCNQTSSNCNQALSKRTNDENKTNKSQAYGCEHAADSGVSSQAYKQENAQALTSANAFISSDPYDFAWSAPIPDFTSVSKLMRCHEVLSSPKQSDDYRDKKINSAAAINQTCAGFNGLNSSADDAYTEGNALNLLACKSMQDLKNIHQALSEDAATAASDNNAAELCHDLASHLYHSHDLAITSPELIAQLYNTCSDLSKDQVSDYLEDGSDGDACNALNSLNLYIGRLIEHDPEALNKLILQSTCNLQGLSAVCQDQDVPKHVPNLSSLFSQNQSSDNDYSATDHMAMISLRAALKAEQAKRKANSDKRTTKENHKTEDELLLEQLNGSNELEVLNNYRMTFNYSLRSNYPEIGPFNQDLAHCDEAQDHTGPSTRSQASQALDKPKAPLVTNMSQNTESLPQESMNKATDTQGTANCSNCATKASQSSSATKAHCNKKGKRNAKQAAVETDGPISFALESFVMNKLNDKGARSQTPKIKKHSFVKKHA